MRFIYGRVARAFETNFFFKKFEITLKLRTTLREEIIKLIKGERLEVSSFWKPLKKMKKKLWKEKHKSSRSQVGLIIA